MTACQISPTRRDTLTTLLAAGAGIVLAGSAATGAAGASQSDPADPHWRDWDWLVGSWAVRHKRLKGRLVGSTTWEEFNGTCVNWPLLGGQGNVDDNLLELPSGDYRGVGLRAYNAETGKWAIWWLDSRNPTRIDPPVYGGFNGNAGEFIGEDTHNGIPVMVRFRWTEITKTTAKWDQAFSTDGGKTWETNWMMDFKRTA